MKKSIITPIVWLVSIVSLLNDISSEMLYPVMPVFLKSIGFSFLLIGILEGFAEATAGISKGYFGNLSDRIGKRVPFVKFGYFLSAISKPMMAVWTFPAWIFIARTSDRLGKGIRTGARDAILSGETDRSNKGKVFGFHRAFDTVGAATGPIVALIYLYYYPGKYSTLFLVAFLPAFIGLSLTFFLRDKKVNETQTSKSAKGFFNYFGYWNQANSDYRFIVAVLLFFTLFNSSDIFLLLGMKMFGLSDQQVIGVYIFYNIAYAILSFPAGILGDRIGLKKTLVIGLIIYSISYAVFPFNKTFGIFILIFLGYGCYAALTEGIAKAYLTNLCEPKDTATAIGFFTSLSSVCTLLASVFGGFIWQKYGPTPAFLIPALAALISAFVILFFRKERIRLHQLPTSTQ